MLLAVRYVYVRVCSECVFCFDYMMDNVITNVKSVDSTFSEIWYEIVVYVSGTVVGMGRLDSYPSKSFPRVRTISYHSCVMKRFYLSLDGKNWNPLG